MIYNNFQGRQLSMLGFGAMRLPTRADGSIDRPRVESMTAYAMEHGINYFDTAYPYHNGQSEIVMGQALSRYPRESYYLATKYPGHQISSRYDPAAIFEEQLQKCGVEYFDFYLLHNVYENSIQTYLDPKWGILEYFREQRRQGRIRHLGFSSHGSLALLRKFLDIAGTDMEFCQLQLNWLDWTLQDARGKVELLNERKIPIWVMEPLRGGRLCELDDAAEARLKSLRPQEKVPAWGFRFLQGIPGVTMVLSGMSDMAQMEANVSTFAHSDPLSQAEVQVLLEIAEGMKNSVPCTACRYCVEACPGGLDIPGLIGLCNELRLSEAANILMRLEGIPEDKRASACLACGRCTELCPQRIDIPEVMKELAEKQERLPKWSEICRRREEAAGKQCNN